MCERKQDAETGIMFGGILSSLRTRIQLSLSVLPGCVGVAAIFPGDWEMSASDKVLSIRPGNGGGGAVEDRLGRARKYLG